MHIPRGIERLAADLHSRHSRGAGRVLAHIVCDQTERRKLSLRHISINTTVETQTHLEPKLKLGLRQGCGRLPHGVQLRRNNIVIGIDDLSTVSPVRCFGRKHAFTSACCTMTLTICLRVCVREL